MIRKDLKTARRVWSGWRRWNTATVIRLSILMIMVCVHKHATSGCFTHEATAHFSAVKERGKPQRVDTSGLRTATETEPITQTPGENQAVRTEKHLGHTSLASDAFRPDTKADSVLWLW